MNLFRQFLISGKALFTTLFIYMLVGNSCIGGSTPEEVTTLKMKATAAEQQLKIAVANNKDVSNVVPKMKQVKVLADNGKIKLANALLNEILSDFEKLNSPSPGNGAFVNPRRVHIINNPYNAMEPFISRDGNILFFNSEKTDTPKTDKDIYYAIRIDDTTFQFMGEVKGINTNSVDGVPTMDVHGNFYYVSTAYYGKDNGYTTVYRGKFINGEVVNITPIPELSLHKPGWLNMDIEISADGSSIYATQTLFSGQAWPKESHFFTAYLQNGKFVIDQNSKEIFKHINTKSLEYAASISTDELELFFTRLNLENGANFATYYTSRPDKNSPFRKPVLLEAINGFSEAPAITGDGRLLYYHKKDTKRFNIYVLERARY